MHADRTNRLALTLFGLLVLIAGAAGMAASAGVFGAAFSKRTLFANRVSAYTGHHGTWVWAAAAAVCLLIALAALRWILVLLVSTDRAGDIPLPVSTQEGTTILQPAALTGALTREIGTYHGVDTTRGRIIGDASDPGDRHRRHRQPVSRPARPAPPHRNRSPRPRPAGTRQGRPAHPAQPGRQPPNRLTGGRRVHSRCGGAQAGQPAGLGVDLLPAGLDRDGPAAAGVDVEVQAVLDGLGLGGLPSRSAARRGEGHGAVSSTNITHACLTPQNARVVPYSPERAMPESPVSEERHPFAKGQPRVRLVQAQALVARQQARAGVVTVAVATMTDGGHVRFSMIPRLVFREYACLPFWSAPHTDLSSDRRKPPEMGRRVVRRRPRRGGADGRPGWRSAFGRWWR